MKKKKRIVPHTIKTKLASKKGISNRVTRLGHHVEELQEKRGGLERIPEALPSEV